MSIAPRGPRSVLWVVVEMTPAWATGDGWAPPATKPGDVGDVGDEDGADLVGDLGEGGEVDGAGDRRAAAEDQLGPLLPGQLAHLVHVDPPVSARTPYCTARNHLPVAETFQPWVRWPPMGRAIPMTVSPGWQEGEIDGQVGR